MSEPKNNDWPIIMIRPSIGINISQITTVQRDGNNTDVYTKMDLFEIPDKDFSLWSRITKDNNHLLFSERQKYATKAWSEFRSARHYKKENQPNLAEMMREDCKRTIAYCKRQYPKIKL
jgi:hypothetical protein